MQLNDINPESRSEILKSILTNRRSIRQFTDAQLVPEHLTTILEAGIYAPSGSNSQNQRFLVIEDPEEKNALGKTRFVWPYPSAEKMREKKISGLIGGAAGVIVVFADAALNDYRDMGEYYIWETLEIQNCAASIENMLNMATALGIGSCWISASDKMSRTRLLSGKSWANALASYQIPAWYKIQGIVILGYPRASNDETGYPKGEKKHGASIWAPTARHSLEHYLIKRKTVDKSMPHPLNRIQHVKLLLLSMLSGILLKLLRTIDHSIYQLEVKQALKDFYNPRRPQEPSESSEKRSH